jgi:hypothetical protein
VVVRKPIWTSSSFLLYAGGLTVLAAAIAALVYLARFWNGGAYVAWTLLPLTVLYLVSFVFRARGEWVAAGMFAVGGLTMWGAFAGALAHWWGWLPRSPESVFAGWHWGALFVVGLVFLAAIVDVSIFHFPLLVLYAVIAAWYFVTDLLSSGGGWSATLTLLVGLLYLFLALGVDSSRRRPYGFWMHAVAGLLVGGALLYWWHSTDLDFALVAVTGVVYVFVAGWTRRSNWAVLGIAGFLAAFGHFADRWAHEVSSSAVTIRDWVPPVVFGVVGFFIVLLGLFLARRRGEETSALPVD